MSSHTSLVTDRFPGPPGPRPGHVSWVYWSISLTSFDGNNDILPPRPLNQSLLKYQYFHQKWSRKPSNIPRKCLRNPRKRVIESRSHHWDIG